MIKETDRVILPTLNDIEGIVLTIDEDREPWERVEVRTDQGVLYFPESALLRK